MEDDWKTAAEGTCRPSRRGVSRNLVMLRADFAAVSSRPSRRGVSRNWKMGGIPLAPHLSPLPQGRE